MGIPITMQTNYSIELIDISMYQDYNRLNQFIGIDFKKVKAVRKSIRGIFVKLGEGTWEGYPFDVADSQTRETAEAGLDVFSTHYWHSEVNPISQARYLKARWDRLAVKSVRILADIEDTDREDNRPPKVALLPADYPLWKTKAIALVRGIHNYLDAIAQEFGEPPVWYGADWYQSWAFWLASIYGEDISWAKTFQFLDASYTAPIMYLPYGIDLDQVVGWQRTSTPAIAEQVDGFPYPEKLDLSWWLKSEAEYLKFAKREASTPPVENKTPLQQLFDWSRTVTPAYTGPDPS